MVLWFTVEIVHRPSEKAAALCQRRHDLLDDFRPQEQHSFDVLKLEQLGRES